MRLQHCLTFAPITLLVNTWVTPTRAAPLSIESNCHGLNCKHLTNGLSSGEGDHTVRLARDINEALYHGANDMKLREPFEEKVLNISIDVLASRGFRLPKTNKPDADTSSSQGDSAFDVGLSIPGSPKSGTSSDCKKTVFGLRVRAGCGTGSGDEEEGGGGYDSDPLEVDTTLANAPAGEGRRVDRNTVRNWYDVVEENPKPLFRAKQDFDRRINSDEPDAVIRSLKDKYVSTSKPLTDLYAGDSDGIFKIFDGLGRSNGIPKTGELRRVEAQQGTGAVQESAFSADGRLIIATWSSKAKDVNRPENQIRWNRLVFNQYRDVMNSKNGGNTKNLQFIGRSQIANPVTINTIKKALTETGQSTNEPDEVVTFRADAPAGSAEAQAFEAITRTDNGNGIYWLLSDFHNELGNKRITQLHVADDAPYFNMLVEIG